MSKKMILVLFAFVGLFFEFGLMTNAAATDQSLVSFSSGALLVETPAEYGLRVTMVTFISGSMEHQ